jgi:hypothetical protein
VTDAAIISIMIAGAIAVFAGNAHRGTVALGLCAPDVAIAVATLAHLPIARVRVAARASMEHHLPPPCSSPASSRRWRPPARGPAGPAVRGLARRADRTPPAWSGLREVVASRLRAGALSGRQ